MCSQALGQDFESYYADNLFSTLRVYTVVFDKMSRILFGYNTKLPQILSQVPLFKV